MNQTKTSSSDASDMSKKGKQQLGQNNFSRKASVVTKGYTKRDDNELDAILEKAKKYQTLEDKSRSTNDSKKRYKASDEQTPKRNTVEIANSYMKVFPVVNQSL